MARNVFAPWAEIVPDVGPMTTDDLLKLPDDGWRYELVDGVLVRMPPPGFRHGDIALELGSVLRVYTKQHHLGEGHSG